MSQVESHTTASTASAPLVSILIPVHNGLAFTRACLESLWAQANDAIPCEILVIDDLSTDGTAEYLQSLGSRVRVLSHDTRKTFSEKINAASTVAAGEYLCLLNNDTTVTPGWLEELLFPARQDPTIAVVGNRHLTPATGLIDHAGIVFNPNGNPAHLYRGQPANFWPALISQEFQAVTAACWLISRRNFLEIGGFDTTYRYGFEDVDFCLRAREKGFRIFYNAESVIYHHGGSTPGRKDHERANSDYFKSQWAASLTRDMQDFYFPPPPPVEPEPVKVPEPPAESPPEPAPQIPDPPAALAPSAGSSSHIEERYAHIERLHDRHPLIASLLRSLVRFATSAAKTLNRWGI